jgi:hypothetical protein
MDVTPPVSSFTDMSRGRTDWLLTLQVEKTFKRTNLGNTLGVVGDVWLPLSRERSLPGGPDAPRLRSRAGRLGLIFDF